MCSIFLWYDEATISTKKYKSSEQWKTLVVYSKAIGEFKYAKIDFDVFDNDKMHRKIL